MGWPWACVCRTRAAYICISWTQYTLYHTCTCKLAYAWYTYTRHGEDIVKNRTDRRSQRWQTWHMMTLRRFCQTHSTLCSRLSSACRQYSNMQRHAIGSGLHLTGHSPEFKDALVQSELGADMAVHGEEVCPSHCKGICEIADTYIFKKTTIARIIQDI